MKHNRNETESAGSEITFVKKTGTAFAAGALSMLAVGAVGLYAMVGGNSIPVNEESSSSETETTTSVSQTETTAETTTTEAKTSEAPEVSAVFGGYDKSISRAAVTIRKAGLDEYDLILETVKATETTASSKKAEESKKADNTETKKTAKTSKNTKKTKKTETTAASDEPTLEDSTLEIGVIENNDASAEGDAVVTKKKKSKKKSTTTTTVSEPQSEVKTCAAMTLYSTEKVNLRTEASLNAEVLEVLPLNAEVIVTGYTEDWYRVKFDGQSGYCMKKYFTSDVPEAPSESVEVKGDVISYNSTEFDMLCYVLQGEVGNCSEASKIAVANVVINRVKDPRFPDSIEGVLTQPSQFDAIYGYYGGYTVPSENTIECAKRALAGEDNTSGAIYYYAPQYVGGDVSSWFESLQLCLELDGQRYFK